MSQIEGLKKELVRVREQNRQLKKSLQQFTLADKAQKIIEGSIKSSDEFDEFGLRLDGESCSRYIFDLDDSLDVAIDYMKPVDRRDTSNIEILLNRYPHELVLEALLNYDLRGFSIAD